MQRLLILFLMTATLLTTGCMKAVLRLNPDGSGSYEIGLNMSIQSLEEAGNQSGGSSDDGMEEIADLMESGEAIVDEKTGISFTAEERLENGSRWTYMIFNVPDVRLWAKFAAATSEMLPEDSEDTPVETSTLTAIPNITIDGSNIRVEMTVPSSADSNSQDDFGMAAIMSAFIQVSYEVQMPGTIIEHNGEIDSLTGNPVWIIDLSSRDDLEIIVESIVE